MFFKVANFFFLFRMLVFSGNMFAIITKFVSKLHSYQNRSKLYIQRRIYQIINSIFIAFVIQYMSTITLFLFGAVVWIFVADFWKNGWQKTCWQNVNSNYVLYIIVSNRIYVSIKITFFTLKKLGKWLFCKCLAEKSFTIQHACKYFRWLLK